MKIKNKKEVFINPLKELRKKEQEGIKMAFFSIFEKNTKKLSIIEKKKEVFINPLKELRKKEVFLKIVRPNYWVIK